MIVAAIDNTLGPLSFLVALPSVTTQLNTSYIRPVTAQVVHIIITGRVLERTRRPVVYDGGGQQHGWQVGGCQLRYLFDPGSMEEYG